MKNISLFLLIMFLFTNCQSALIKKEQVIEFNAYLKDRSYYLKEDILVAEGEVFKKGMLVKLWVESTPSLLKIKCYPAQEDRENTSGKLAIYIINEDFKKKEFTLADLENLIEPKMKLYKNK